MIDAKSEVPGETEPSLKLKTWRDGCKVYISPEWVNRREFVYRHGYPSVQSDDGRFWLRFEPDYGSLGGGFFYDRAWIRKDTCELVCDNEDDAKRVLARVNECVDKVYRKIIGHPTLDKIASIAAMLIWHAFVPLLIASPMTLLLTTGLSGNGPATAIALTILGIPCMVAMMFCGALPWYAKAFQKLVKHRRKIAAVACILLFWIAAVGLVVAIEILEIPLFAMLDQRLDDATASVAANVADGASFVFLKAHSLVLIVGITMLAGYLFYSTVFAIEDAMNAGPVLPPPRIIPPTQDANQCR